MTKLFQCAFSLLLLLPIAVRAQDISGSIQGSVLDPSGAAVPNAKVTATNTDRNQVVRTFTTDSGGNYSLPVLPIGHYSIKVEANGFKTATHEGVGLAFDTGLRDLLLQLVGRMLGGLERQDAVLTLREREARDDVREIERLAVELLDVGLPVVEGAGREGEPE